MVKRVLPFVLAAFLTGLDQLTKHIVSTHISKAHPLRITPFFQLVYVENKGAAFGLFQFLGNGVFIGISIVAIVFVLYIMFKEKENPYIMALVLAGAMGNLMDRLRLGYVVDFLDFHIGSYHWPAFNVADSCLSVGLVLLFLRMFFRPHKTGL
ncbi:MAG: signal peptidase II [Nitrospirae bacterium]|nr:MAG: signal peptidase II [Nitrospirota bacterium]